MENITEYLIGKTGITYDNNKFKREVKDDCFKHILFKIFEVDVDCRYYEQVAFGEGNEQEKIDSVYSSSLQSLLIFSQVKEGNPIEIEGIPYTQVQFEYKNKVIGTPSSVDVVLSDKDNKNVLFIESKLYEIVRDSSHEGKPVIGPSYLSDNKNGYKKFDLEKAKFDKIGIEIPNLEHKPFESKAKDIKAELKNKHKDKVNGEGYLPVEKSRGARFVYSYGIKQILSHLIGLMNLDDPGANCSNEFAGNHGNVRFISLYNELPKYNEQYPSEEAKAKIEDYIAHEEKVKEMFSRRILTKGKDGNEYAIEILSPMSYQKIYAENTDYFKGMDTIVKFYHLIEGDPI